MMNKPVRRQPFYPMTGTRSRKEQRRQSNQASTNNRVWKPFEMVPNAHHDTTKKIFKTNIVAK